MMHSVEEMMKQCKEIENIINEFKNSSEYPDIKSNGLLTPTQFGLPTATPVPITGLLSDEAILQEPGLVIDPINLEPCPRGTISYGLSSYGYDLRLGYKFKVFTNARCAIVDPKNFDEKSFIDVTNDHCLIPPNSFVLAESVEYLEIPRDVLGICIGKSTYARCGIIIPMTPLEPEWRGKVTIEISNTTPLPAKIYAGEGICQVLFIKSPFPVTTSYNDKKGRYQDQKGLTLPPKLKIEREEIW